ncbi:MAG: CPBP family intramembrane glutamic endopeptidase, partial [Planctomycetota bacterium]
IKTEIEARGGTASTAEFFALVEDAKAGKLDPEITLLSDDQREALIDRHGFYAQVALTHQLPDTDPARAELVSGGGTLVAVLVIAGLGGAAAILAGCVLFVLGMILMGTGKLRSRFAPPEPGGSVMLEVFCWFVGGFLVVSLGSDLIARVVRTSDPTATWPAMVPLFAQWLLLLAPLWPLLRGVSRADLARLLGWNTGRGLFKEIGFGFLAYLAGLPVFLAAVIATLGLITLVDVITGGSAAPTSSPVVELVAGGSTLSLVLIFMLATIWAPFCEELVFRGALQRHIRARLAGPLAILATAAVFGFMHGYGPLFVLPLIALGFVFGAMRELRGTIIPSITAHFLHNATVLTLVITIVQLTN